MLYKVRSAFAHATDTLCDFRRLHTAHAAYHKAGVLHGHIAPQNIMFVCSGSGDEEVTSGILIDLDSAVCWEEQPSGQLSQNKQDEGTKGG